MDCTIDKYQILSSIPEDALTEKGEYLNKIEYRWRIMKFPDKENEYIEISRKMLDGERLFLTHKNEWIKKEETPIYDKYVVKQYYNYV